MTTTAPTVNVHLRQIYVKFRVDAATGAVVRAVRDKLVLLYAIAYGEAAG